MSQKQGLPPGWGGKSENENPWANLPQADQQPFSGQEERSPWPAQMPRSVQAEEKQPDLLPQPDMILEAFRKKAASAKEAVKQSGAIPDADAVLKTLRQKTESAKGAAKQKVSAFQERAKELRDANPEQNPPEQAAAESFPVNQEEPIMQAKPDSENAQQRSPANLKTERQSGSFPYPNAQAIQQNVQPKQNAPIVRSHELDDELDQIQLDLENDHRISPLIFLIPVVVLVLGFLGGLLWIRSRQNKTDAAEMIPQQQSVPVQEDSVPDSLPESNTIIETTESSAEIRTETQQAESVEGSQQLSETKAEIPQYSHQNQIVPEETPEPDEPSEPAFDLPAEYRAIVIREDVPINTGYYADVNGDGQNELILKNPDDMNFHMYLYDAGTGIREVSFGAYKSMNEAKLFRVPAANGQYYLYWRCEYMLYSIQGYYDPFTNSEIDIGINYNFEDHAEWKLWFNDNEYASGREEGGSTYGATPNCYQNLLNMFQDYGFQIYDNSDYIQLDCLNQNELLNAIR